MSSLALTIHGIARWQLLHRGVPDDAAGTRFLRPQFGHLTRSSAIARRLASRVLVADDQFGRCVIDLYHSVVLRITAQ